MKRRKKCLFQNLALKPLQRFMRRMRKRLLLVRKRRFVYDQVQERATWLVYHSRTHALAPSDYSQNYDPRTLNDSDYHRLFVQFSQIIPTLCNNGITKPFLFILTFWPLSQATLYLQDNNEKSYFYLNLFQNTRSLELSGLNKFNQICQYNIIYIYIISAEYR